MKDDTTQSKQSLTKNKNAPDNYMQYSIAISEPSIAKGFRFTLLLYRVE